MIPDLVNIDGVELLHPLEQAQGVEVAGAGADLGIEAGHGLEVVVEDVGLRRDDGLEGAGAAAQEVGRQDLDRRRRVLAADGADGLGDVLGAAVAEVVAVDRGDDDVVEAELLDGDGDARRLEHVEGVGAAGGDVAEGAAAGADLAHDHHRGVALGPALADVGAARLLADGDEAVLPHDLAGPLVALGGRRLDANPVGLAQDRGVGLVGLLRMALGAVAEVSRAGVPVAHGYSVGGRAQHRARLRESQPSKG